MGANLLNFQTIIIIAGIAGVLLVYRLLNGARDSVPKLFRTELILFVPQGGMYHLQAENQGGFLLTERQGGYGEMPGTATYLRFGRPMIQPSSEAHGMALRKRRPVYMARQFDPTPLTLSAGPERGYMGQLFTHAHYRVLKDLNTHAASSTAITKGNLKDVAFARLAIVTGVAVAGAVLCWAAVIGGSIALGVKL